jgi:alkylhydroperoxidase family enzyme
VNQPVSDEVFDEVSRYFTTDEIINLLMAIVTINSWNRIAIPTRKVPGTYEPQPLKATR